MPVPPARSLSLSGAALMQCHLADLATLGGTVSTRWRPAVPPPTDAMAAQYVKESLCWARAAPSAWRCVPGSVHTLLRTLVVEPCGRRPRHAVWRRLARVAAGVRIAPYAIHAAAGSVVVLAHPLREAWTQRAGSCPYPRPQPRMGRMGWTHARICITCLGSPSADELDMLEGQVRLPDGQRITLHAQRFQVPEVTPRALHGRTHTSNDPDHCCSFAVTITGSPPHRVPLSGARRCRTLAQRQA